MSGILLQRTPVYLIACFCLCMGLVPDITSAASPTEFFVGSVTFEGVESVPRKILSKTLAARSAHQWKFWKYQDPVESEDLEDDVARIQQFYQARGYYHAVAVYKIVHRNREKKVASSDRTCPVIDVVFTVSEGPPAEITHITLRIEPTIDGVSEKDLLRRLPVQTGQIFETENYRQSKRLIAKTLGNLGYAFPKTNGQVRVSTATNHVEIGFDIHPGAKYTFGPLSVSREKGHVKTHIVRRALRFKQGDVYNQDRVEESQRNLYSLDAFRAAVIKPLPPAPGSSEIPITIETKPKKKRRIKLGAGYGTEDGFRIKGSWTYRNVLNRAGKLSISAKRSDIIENAEIEYSQPYIIDAETHLRTKTGIQRDILESYTTRKTFGRLAVDRDLKKSWEATVAYNLEINEIEKLSITDVENQDIGDEENYLISSVEGVMTYDATDDNFNPTSGTVMFLSYEQASGLFGSETKFLSPAFEIKKYQPLFKSVSIAGRVRIQSIVGTEDTEDLPIFKRLFLGGSNTVRGYAYQQLPPLDSEEKPIGGLSSLNANLELRYPIYKKISGIAFLDMGLLEEDPFYYDIANMRFSCGGGIRYHTIIGPIRVDLGYKLNPPTRGDLGYATDRNEEIGDRWRIHFSIGHAF